MRYFYVVLVAGIACEAHGAEAERCVPQAAAYHRVNEEVLRSILQIESSNRPLTLHKNANGTIDVGLGGTNSLHFPELAKYGVTPAHLLEPCNSTFTTAWLLARGVRRYGETWFGYAAFHSTTPYYNRRYQILLHNDLVRRGKKQGETMAVPPLRPQ